MNRCEHGQKINKFCINQICHHKEAGGCDYCIKKYHFHLTNTKLLAQTDIDGIIRAITISPESKYKCRSLLQASIDYLKTLKQSVVQWIDAAHNTIYDRLSYPLVRKQGFLSIYNKLKNREYRKLNAKDIKTIYDHSKSVDPQKLKKQQIQAYFEQASWVVDIMKAVDKLQTEVGKLPDIKQEGNSKTALPSLTKILHINELILGEQQKIGYAKNQEQSNKIIKPQTHSDKKITKDIKQVIKSNKVSVQNLNSASKEVAKRQAELIKDKVQNQVHVNNFIDHTDPKKQEKFELKIKKRRSSIDQKLLDVKFKLIQEKTLKENEERIKRMQEVIEQKQDEKEKDTNNPKQEQINSGKSVEEKLREIKNLSTQNTAEKRIEEERQQDNQKSENMIPNVLNGLIPPRPPQLMKNQSQIQKKVIKIPLKQINEQIQSPIFKKKQQMEKSQAFQFTLIKTDRGGDPQLDPVVQIKKQNQQSPDHNRKQDQSFLNLESNQKNSLLLFSEALKADSQKAIELLKASLKYSPNNLSAAQYLSYLYLQTKQAKQCFDVCQATLSMLENHPTEFQITLHLHNNKAAALNQMGRYSQSILILQKCLKSRRKHYFYKNLGDAYFSLSISEKAAMNYEKAVRLDPGYDEAFYNLAVTQYIQQQYSSAKLNIEQAKRIDNQNEDYMELYNQIVKKLDALTL